MTNHHADVVAFFVAVPKRASCWRPRRSRFVVECCFLAGIIVACRYDPPWHYGFRREGESCTGYCTYAWGTGDCNPSSDCRFPLACEGSDSLCSASDCNGTCRRTCEADSDCPDGCTCMEGEYNIDPGDGNPKTCRGGWACGGVIESCDVGRQDCDQSHRVQTCVGGWCRPPGPRVEGDGCGWRDTCGMRLVCVDYTCRRACGDGNPCSAESACVDNGCFLRCEMWSESCAPTAGGLATSCRPTDDGGAVCVNDESGDSEGHFCFDTVDCRRGMFCSSDHACRRFCDEDHNTCGDRPCLMAPDAGIGFCDCRPADYDAGLWSCEE
jgi:hypothetical protein